MQEEHHMYEEMVMEVAGPGYRHDQVQLAKS